MERKNPNIIDRVLESEVIQKVEEELNIYQELGLTFNASNDHTARWTRKISNPWKSFIKNGNRIDAEVMRNFRRYMIYADDSPQKSPSRLNLKALLMGRARGEREVLRRCLSKLKDRNFHHLLLKYPCHPAGNPHVFRHAGYLYTHRWFRHIFFLGLMKRVLGNKLNKNFISLDIGSGYGIFSSLVYQEYPGSRHVLVDLPEQLLLARYFLSMCVPDAKIAGVKEISHENSISRDFLEKYDFVLMPNTFYENISPGSVDLITSFASLGELKRSIFDYYVQSPVFQKATYFFTANPVQSSLWFKDTDLTILDYPIWDSSKKLHFRVSPAFSYNYGYPKSRFFFSYEIQPFWTFFEYIGLL